MSQSDQHNAGAIDFSMLLASSVHDIKNSLGMLLTSLDDVIDVKTQESPEQRKHYSILRSEASRINNSLIYLLGLYKLQNNQLSLSVDDVFVADFLGEQVASQQLLFDVNQITVDISCDENLTAFFDENLVAGVINNILVNCAKYTKDNIQLSAKQIDQYLHIRISDNGNGYPNQIIEKLNSEERGIDFNSGSTNLGLYFSQQIAALHRCKDRIGSIALSNLDSGGGCFLLKLP